MPARMLISEYKNWGEKVATKYHHTFYYTTSLGT